LRITVLWAGVLFCPETQGKDIESVIGYWKGKTVLQGTWLNASNIENMNFKIWNFIDAGGNTQRMNTPQPPDVPYGYAIGDSGQDMGKLIVATFNIYLEAQRYKEASENTTITVPHDYTMPRQLIIPEPGATGITLTIKGVTATTKITRGTVDPTASNGLFQVESGRRLVFENIVIDGNGNQSTHTDNKASLVRVNAGGTFTMKAGAVLQNNRAINGGGVYSSGSFTMSGGEISVNTASTSSNSSNSYGGGVYFSGSGTFTMSGGSKITNNTVTSGSGTGGGGGVYVTTGTFTMNNGTMSGNTASSTSGSGLGGGVYVSGGSSGGTFNMYGGGVYNNGTFTVGGTAKVKDNTKTDNSTNSNAYISASTYITLGAGANVPVANMEIWAQTARPDTVLVQSVTNGTVVTYFHADEIGKSVVFDVNVLKIINN